MAAVSRVAAVFGRSRGVDATRGHLRMTWVVSGPTLGRFGPNRVAIARIRSKSQKKRPRVTVGRHRNTAQYLVELLVRVLRVELRGQNFERNDTSDLQLSATETVLALRASSLRNEGLDDLPQAHAPSSLREPPPYNLPAISLERDGAEFSTIILAIRRDVLVELIQNTRELINQVRSTSS